MWKVYKWNGHYIQGDLISKHSSEDAALKRAAKEMKFTCYFSMRLVSFEDSKSRIYQKTDFQVNIKPAHSSVSAIVLQACQRQQQSAYPVC